MKVIAVDFDGTLCENQWPEVGRANRDVINYLLQRQAMGDKLILWACRTGELLHDAVIWCNEHRLMFDAVNANLPERIAEYGNDCRKISADEYWDDKSVVVRAGERPSILLPTDFGYSHIRWEKVELAVAELSPWKRLKRQLNHGTKKIKVRVADAKREHALAQEAPPGNDYIAPGLYRWMLDQSPIPEHTISNIDELRKYERQEKQDRQLHYLEQKRRLKGFVPTVDVFHSF